MSARTERVLIAGRSGSVLVDAVKLLRDRGCGANATNQFDTLLDDYDMREVDLVIFGGMVPPDKKERLQAEIRTLNPQMKFMQGLGGIAPLLVAQVEELFGGGAGGVEYDAGARAFRVTLTVAAPVMVHALWATFVPPEPVGHSAVAFDGELAAGAHKIAIPDEVPRLGTYAVVRIEGRVSAFQIGETPESIKRIAAAQTLPAPEHVTTRFPWE
ncbi:hypothetical protein P3H15_49280 [Rhodococcus sp. T2V]|uniref:hypothetical protein n=1 Tax=Rhodococcus sp. T2V TaxID=3034164 RepID=UPI0023E228C1|nr:hypothetical protein [Rhodococcus sp. T2V]MDF3312927.1 hypothetical protein [Rhodococcus sp. T2V]